MSKQTSKSILSIFAIASLVAVTPAYSNDAASEKALLQALAVAQANKQPATQYEVYRKLAAHARKQKWNDKFVAYEKAALALCPAMPQANKTKDAEIYCDLGNFYLEKDKYALAAENLELCLNIVRPMCSENSLTTLNLEDALSELYVKLGDKSKAAHWNKMAVAHSRSLMETIQGRIKAVWFPQKWPSSMHALALFKVNGRGDLFDIRFSDSSQAAGYLDACREAIKGSDAKPMQSWQYYAPAVDVEFKFDYNVHAGSQSTGQKIPNGARPGYTAPTPHSPPGHHAELAMLKGINKINDEINKQLAEFIAIDTEKTTLSLPAALKAVALSEQYLNLGQADKAEALIKDLLQRPGLSKAESTSKTMLQAEMGCILLKEQKLPDASLAFKESSESPLFDQIPLSEQQRFLKSYGDAQFKQGKETEANAIYARRAALTDANK